MRETPHIKVIRKQLGMVQSMGHHMSRVFNDWTSLMLSALMSDDAEYLATMKQYDNTRTYDGLRPANCFANAFGALMLHMRETNEEVLGALYMEMASNPHSGQFFTPPAVCDMMARIAGHDSEVPEAPVRILDPACGAGAQLVAAAKNMSIVAANGSFFMGIDIDPACCRMAALNLLFFNLNGVVVHGNALSNESWGGYATSRSLAFGGSIRRLAQEEAAGALEGAAASLEVAA